jgi:hypothetical protein
MSIPNIIGTTADSGATITYTFTSSIDTTTLQPGKAFDIRSYLISQNIIKSVNASINLRIVINNGVVVGSSSPSKPVITIANFHPIRDRITLTNNGSLQGAGGVRGGAGDVVGCAYTGCCGGGGCCTALSQTAGSAGGAGGDVILLQSVCTIINNGNIYSGGGGGGGGGSVGGDSCGGCGGQNCCACKFCSGTHGSYQCFYGGSLDANGSAGSLGQGYNQAAGARNPGVYYGGYGGEGGTFGGPGADGQPGQRGYPSNGGKGGSPGYYLDGMIYVASFTNTGSVLGLQK